MRPLKLATPCVSCGRMMWTIDPTPECMSCFNMDLTNREYEEDAAHLEAMPYRQYLKSSHWQAVRQDVLDLYGRQCAVCCSRLLLHVHHREYPPSRLEIKPSMLILLCQRCHERLHSREDK